MIGKTVSHYKILEELGSGGMGVVYKAENRKVIGIIEDWCSFHSVRSEMFIAQTYTQIYIHVVFAVQDHRNIIPQKHKEELHKYITGIIRNKNQKLIAINSMPDHLHIFIGMKPNITLSDLVRDIKNNSSTFINKKKWLMGKFSWQEGFGAFTYGQSQVDMVVKYIQNQDKHHTKQTFREEYLKMLRRFKVEYDNKYIFEWIGGE